MPENLFALLHSTPKLQKLNLLMLQARILRIFYSPDKFDRVMQWPSGSTNKLLDGEFRPTEPAALRRMAFALDLQLEDLAALFSIMPPVEPS